MRAEACSRRMSGAVAECRARCAPVVKAGRKAPRRIANPLPARVARHRPGVYRQYTLVGAGGIIYRGVRWAGERVSATQMRVREGGPPGDRTQNPRIKSRQSGGCTLGCQRPERQSMRPELHEQHQIALVRGQIRGQGGWTRRSWCGPGTWVGPGPTRCPWRRVTRRIPRRVAPRAGRWADRLPRSFGSATPSGPASLPGTALSVSWR